MNLKPGIYRHFKGNLYELVDVAYHSETLEPMVVYRALYGERKLWVRPAAMWTEHVERDDYQGPRFRQEEGVEYFPIMNEQGEVIGAASRQDCHSRQTFEERAALMHPVVHLHVFSTDGKLYLQRRALHKDLLPGYWDTAVGGHVIYGETIAEALKREVEEEIGLTDYTPEHMETYRYDSTRECELVHVFRATTDGPFRWNDGEVIDGRFWSREELADALGKGILTPNLEMELKRFGIV